MTDDVWTQLDVFDPDDLLWLESQARAAAVDAREQAEAIAQAQGCPPQQIAQLGDRVEAIYFDTFLANVLSLQRRAMH